MFTAAAPSRSAVTGRHDPLVLILPVSRMARHTFTGVQGMST
jgi:hypothetical protein